MTPAQSIRFQVIPGYCGKMHVGLKGMSVTTCANVLTVLWPNCSGGHSENFTLSDLSGNNGIDPTTIYIARRDGRRTDHMVRRTVWRKQRQLRW